MSAAAYPWAIALRTAHAMLGAPTGYTDHDTHANVSACPPKPQTKLFSTAGRVHISGQKRALAVTQARAEAAAAVTS
jgi:hypothetical protein